MMKKWMTYPLAVVLVGFLASPCPAVIGTIDRVPAATLLAPYFEVDPAQPDGVTTLLLVRNVSPKATLVRVTLWTDLGYPTLGFHIFLTGYDVQDMNLRDIFDYGYLPFTADYQNDLHDYISPQGAPHDPFTSLDDPEDTSFPGCDGILPYEPMSTDEIVDLRAAHTGLPSPYGLFVSVGRAAAVDHGDNIARGYVTLDVVNRCSELSPADPGYFLAGGSGVAANDNVLTGDFLLVDLANNFMQGDTLISIEADAINPETSTPGEYTFYSTFLPVPGSAVDNREALPNEWAVPYRADSAVGGRAELLVWRDPGAPVQPFTPGVGPGAPIPLRLKQAIPFDSEEEPGLTGGETAIPWVSARVPLSAPGIQVPARQGWIYLNLNDPDDTPPFDGIRQSWVIEMNQQRGIFSSGRSGVALGNAAVGP